MQYKAHRKMAMAPASLDRESRTFEVVIATEDNIDGMVLPMAGLRSVERLKFFDNHSYSTTEQLGSIDQIRVVGDELVGRVTVIRGPVGDQVLDNVEDGHLDTVSVGAVIHDYVEVKEGETREVLGHSYTGLVRVATDWEVYEVSSAPLPADPRARVRSKNLVFVLEEGTETDRRASGKNPAITPREETMSDEKKGPEVKQETPATDEVIRKAVEEATKRAEEKAKLEIETRQSEFAAEIELRALVAKHELSEDEFAAKKSLDEKRSWVIKQLSESCKPAPRQHIEVTRDRRESLTKTASDALLIRAGVIRGDKYEIGGRTFEVSGESRENANLGFTGLLRSLLEDEGVSTRSYNDRGLLKLIRSGQTHTSSDFSNILEDTINKTLGVGFELAPTTWQAWTRTTTVNDLRTNSITKLGGFSSLARIDSEAAEIPHGTMDDKKETYRAYQFARNLTVTDEMIINDDLGAFASIALALGNASNTTVQEYVDYTLLSNPTMVEDSTALFAAGHNNLDNSGAAVSVASLNVAKAAMRNQTNLNGKPLNVMPRFLIVCPEIEATALQILDSQFDPASTGAATVNPFNGVLELVVDPYLSSGVTIDRTGGAALSASGDTNAWYLAGDPNRFDTIIVGFLNGQQAPEVLEDRPVDILGRCYSVRSAFGVGVGDYRALYKNVGG